MVSSEKEKTYACDPPSSVSLQLTENCNLRCKMCYEWGEKGCYNKAGSQAKPASLDINLLKRVIHDLAPAKPAYDLFGGEPLVYPHLEELIRTVKEAGSFIDTPTNGTLLKNQAPMLVRTGFDSVRVSIDGPREINDAQRGRGSYEKAMNGIEALHREKENAGVRVPVISTIFTVTAGNYLSIEQFFLKELNLSAIDWVTIQMQNYITEPMGRAYARMLDYEFGIKSDRYWHGCVCSPSDFAQVDVDKIARQVNTVCEALQKMGKTILLIPPTFSADNLSAYLRTQWSEMSDRYRRCSVPWHIIDITATGNVASCHVFYDLTMGNLYEQSLEEIWNGERYKRFREYMDQHGLMSICYGCCILYLAGN
jgi:radical SAM protein with 4Fe4S-binding SPASM domain